MRKHMGVALGLYIKNTTLVEQIDTNSATCMDDFLLFKNDTCVHNTPVSFKESNVARLGLREAGKTDTLLGLLVGIARQAVASCFEDHLYKSRAINAKGRATSPLIRSMQVLACYLQYKTALLRVASIIHIALIIVVGTSQLKLAVFIKG